MTEVALSPSFRRAYRKRIHGRRELEERFARQLELFIQNPHDPRLRTHKLSGQLKELWSFTVDYDCRVVFYFTSGGGAVFVGIGKHDAVY